MAQNLLVAFFNLLLLALVLGAILLSAVTMLGFGFLCHQFLRSEAPPCTRHLRDPGSIALLVTGFLLLLPLLVLALATYRRRPGLRLHLADCPVPYSRALYRRQRIPQPKQIPVSPGCSHRERSGSEVLRVKNSVDCPPDLSRT